MSKSTITWYSFMNTCIFNSWSNKWLCKKKLEREREINEPNDKELKRIYDEHDDDDDDSSDGDDDDSSDDDDEISVIYNRKPCRNKQMSAVAL